LLGFIQKLLGNKNAKEIKRIRSIVEEINGLEPSLLSLSDTSLRAKTEEFKGRLAKGETLDDILPEAFAVVREASKRVLGMRHFDVQMIGGIVLHRGNIAEMRTGEGKTLVATLPVYLNALSGKGVHVVTVNDYLAKRDSEWMGRLYNFLGLSTGLIVAGLDYDQRKQSYGADITYGTNNEFGFDYLRDNMVVHADQMVQRPLNYAIVDEVDSILIDEARTPLIISGPGERSTERYYELAKVVPHLVKDEDYTIDEKQKTIAPTEEGIAKVEKMLHIENLYDSSNLELNHLLSASLRAYAMMERDKDYVVKDGEVVIVDEFTGRLMFGRRYSDGLHQAIEAKEGLRVERESQTLASITFQNYFRMYHKLSGMTGTAETEAGELWDIYKLDVVVIPTNKPIARQDLNDRIYKTVREKYNAVIEEVVKMVEQGRPVLVGTTSVEISELLSRMLKMRGIQHNVLNAKLHQQEADIVAQAGRPGVVTIATNMAGRGTDIKLTDEVKAAGGLAIIGTERHESRRVDRQLRGRAGRQGDVGSSVFYVSLEDHLMRLFGSDRLASLMDRMGLQEGEMLEAKMLTNAVERAQKKVEENHFGVRKRLLEFDDVMNSQREVIYGRRRHALMGERLEMDVMNTIYDAGYAIVSDYLPNADYQGFCIEVKRTLNLDSPFSEQEFAGSKVDELSDKLYDIAIQAFNARRQGIIDQILPVLEQIMTQNPPEEAAIAIPLTDTRLLYQVRANIHQTVQTKGKSAMNEFMKVLVLHHIDEAWKEHLRIMDELRQSVQNASYENKDPLLIYKLESFDLFHKMLLEMNRKTTSVLMRLQLNTPSEEEVRAAEEAEELRRRQEAETRVAYHESRSLDEATEYKRQPVRNGYQVSRNDLCPCGSGLKFKACHGKHS